VFFMNEWDIEEAVARNRAYPVLGPASRTLEAFKDEINRCSDGWPYWSAATRAARKLMELIEGNHALWYGTAAEDVPTAAQLKAAYSPIRAFCTRHNVRFDRFEGEVVVGPVAGTRPLTRPPAGSRADRSGLPPSDVAVLRHRGGRRPAAKDERSFLGGFDDVGAE